MLGYLSANIVCSEKRTVSVSFEEQIMSKDKYPSIFSRQMEAIVFIILQIFSATRAVLKIGEYSRISPSFSLGIFGHVTCLDQWRTSENIWWIITTDNKANLWSEEVEFWFFRNINSQKSHYAIMDASKR